MRDSCSGKHTRSELPNHPNPKLLSPDNFKNRVLELNASDERGISIIREKVKTFARQTPRAQVVASDGKTYPCPPYKIIVLDEADSMTQDAQGALRRIMETHARITRFCLVCNYVTRCRFPSSSYTQRSTNPHTRIIEPLASRCSKFRFTPLDSVSTTSRLEYIAREEKVDVDADVLNALIRTSGGDLRRAITYLQSASRLSTSTNPPVPITAEEIQEIAGVIPDSVVEDFARTLGVEITGGMEVDRAPGGRSFEKIQKHVKQLMRDGYSGTQILAQVSRELWLPRAILTKDTAS